MIRIWNNLSIILLNVISYKISMEKFHLDRRFGCILHTFFETLVCKVIEYLLNVSVE